MSIEKVLYRAHAHVTGGREGTGVSSDGNLNVKLTTPKELGGAGAEAAEAAVGGPAGAGPCPDRGAGVVCIGHPGGLSVRRDGHASWLVEVARAGAGFAEVAEVGPGIDAADASAAAPG